nr:metallophosphatase family protein [Candidatus Frankia alpina]
MRVHVVSDVHGRADALPAAAEGADVFICLGDLILFIDYHDHSRGIMGDLFGAEAVGRMVELRTAQRFDEAREWSRSLWARFGGDRAQIVETASVASTSGCSRPSPPRPI